MKLYFFTCQPYFGHWGMTPFMVLQDMSDDEIIGLKSTSIKFKKNIKYLYL